MAAPLSKYVTFFPSLLLTIPLEYPKSLGIISYILLFFIVMSPLFLIYILLLLLSVITADPLE